MNGVMDDTPVSGSTPAAQPVDSSTCATGAPSLTGKNQSVTTIAQQLPRLARYAFLGIGITILCAVVAPPLSAQTDLHIARVEVEGNVSIPQEAILRHVKTKPGRTVDPSDVREDVRQLYETRWFFSVEPRYRKTKEGSVLVFRVLERPIVRSVRFVGNTGRVKDKHLSAWTGLEPGSPFDINVNRDAVKRIEERYREKGYAFVKVELEKGDNENDREVVFRITEGPIVRVASRKIRIIPAEGQAPFVSPARLKTKLVTKETIAGVPLGGLYDPATIEGDKDALKQYYQSFGYFDAKIHGEPEFSQDRSRVTMRYTVNEGVRYRIRNVSVQGNEVLRREQLMPDFELKDGEFFHAGKLSKDVSEMKDKYGKLGRLYTSVDAAPRFLEEAGMIDVVYRISEREVRYIRNVNVHYEGDYPHTKRTVVLDRSLIHPGDKADPKLIAKTKRRLAGSGLLEGQSLRVDVKPVEMSGRPMGDSIVRGQAPRPERIVPRHKFSPERHTPKPAFGHSNGTTHQTLRPTSQQAAPPKAVAPQNSDSAMLQRSPPATSRIELPPVYEPTSEHVVFYPREDVIFRAQNLNGPFRAPNNPIYDNSPLGDPLGRSIREPPAGYVDLDIYATEARTGRLMFGVGVNSDAGVVGSVVIDESNFDLWRWPRSVADIIDGRAWRGGGQRFRLEAVPGDQVSRYSFQWTDPFFLHTDYSLSVNGFYFQRFYDDWNEERLGGRVSVGKQITPEWSVRSAFRYEEVTLSDPRGNPVPALLSQALGDNILSTGRVTVAHDTRDSVVLPGEGHYGEMSYEQAFGDFDYPRFEGEYRQYFTTHQRPDGSGQQVLTLGGTASWTGDDTPIFERFFAGGFQTFRGFAFRGVSPRENGVVTGGTFMAVGTAEYRIPITANDMVQAVIFSDLGTVDTDVSFDKLRLTVGAGLRLTVPQMGPVPLAFDFGFPILKEDIDERRVFSFYVGVNR